MQHIIYDKKKSIQIDATYSGDNVWVSGHVGGVKILNLLYPLDEFLDLLLAIKQYRNK